MKGESHVGKRIIAAIVDYTIIMLFIFVYIYAFGEPNDTGGYTVSGLLGLIPILFWGIMTIGMEQWFGATLGNYTMSLKPKSLNGNTNDKITFKQSLKRHLLDFVDMSLFGIVAIITINNTENKQRLGDLFAKTIVISTKLDTN